MDVDKNNNKDKAPKEASKPSIDLGARLAEARSNLGLSVEDIAGELRLSNQVIEKIEISQFEMDLPTTFVRGYVKSYATYVGLDTEPLLAQFDQEIVAVSPSLKSVQSISRFDTKRKEINSTSGIFKGITVFILVVFLSLAGWEIFNRYQTIDDSDFEKNQIDLNTNGDIQLDASNPDATNVDINSEMTSPEMTSQELASGEISDLSSEQDLNIDDPQVNDTQEKLKDAIEPQEESIGLPEMQPMKPIAMEAMSDAIENQDTQSNASSVELSELVLDFSGECWVEIIDARGEILANGIKAAGKHMPLKGVPPIKVVLGNPNVVTMSYQGEDYPIKTYRQGVRADITLQ